MPVLCPLPCLVASLVIFLHLLYFALLPCPLPFALPSVLHIPHLPCLLLQPLGSCFRIPSPQPGFSFAGFLPAFALYVVPAVPFLAFLPLRSVACLVAALPQFTLPYIAFFLFYLLPASPQLLPLPILVGSSYIYLPLVPPSPFSTYTTPFPFLTFTVPLICCSCWLVGWLVV